MRRGGRQSGDADFYQETGQGCMGDLWGRLNSLVQGGNTEAKLSVWQTPRKCLLKSLSLPHISSSSSGFSCLTLSQQDTVVLIECGEAESRVKCEGLGLVGQQAVQGEGAPSGMKGAGDGCRGQLLLGFAYILSLSPVLLDDHPGLELCERWRTKGLVSTGEKAC